MTLGAPATTAAPRPSDDPLIALLGVKKVFTPRRGFARRGAAAPVRAVDGVDLSIARGETLALVGETGCGKSTTGRMIVRLIEPDAGRIVFDGQDVTHLPQRKLRLLRRDLQIIFQDPSASLNPRHTIDSILAAPFRVHGIGESGRDRRARVVELLELVGLTAGHLSRYPHEVSGGQRQRVAIARALASRPRVVVCDEPTAGLDVSVRAQITNLLVELRQTLGTTYLLIAHDMFVVSQIADRVAVMYLGKVVEVAPPSELTDRPMHPYTKALVSATPIPDPVVERSRQRIVLPGDPPSPSNPPPGCPFHTRCWKAQDVCRTEEPALRPTLRERSVACHFPESS